MNALLAIAQFPPVDQRYLFQARQMQALSLSVHIPLVCFGLAFPAIILFAEWRYLRTGQPVFNAIARTWSKTMITLFGVGVVTGTILSFEFGLLWPGLMASFGNVFGLGFALEGFSFFLEAIFIAIYVYGWDRLAPKVHFLCGIPVAIAGVTGSFFVISTNAWMNHPSGFVLKDGRATDVHPWSALFGNPYLWHEFVHMYFAGYVVTGFLVAGYYAWRCLRGYWTHYERTALTIALSAAAVATPLQGVIGDWVARDVAQMQPVKLAAMEGVGQTTNGAPEHLLGWYDGKKVVYGIAVPHLLSLLAFHDPNATVKGLDAIPSDQRPPVNVVRFAFQTMVGIASLLSMISTFYLYVRFRLKRLPVTLWFYRSVVLAGPLSVVALIAGWITTEVGRQPWVVYGFMRTTDAVTGAKGIPVGYGTLVLVYLGLGIAAARLMYIIGRGPTKIPGTTSAIKPSMLTYAP
jgi:cytochrome bd ubiquinol oxidase subunit I